MAGEAGADVRIRAARGPDERLRARTVVDAAMLDPPDDPDRWLVAVAGGGESDGGEGGGGGESDDEQASSHGPPASGRVVGALALEGDRVAAVAVRPGRRGQAIGTALVRAAAARRDRLVARFDPGVAPFYEALGFEVAPVDPAEPDGRRHGVLAGDGVGTDG